MTLLKNEKAITLLIKFLKSTKIEKRKRTKKESRNRLRNMNKKVKIFLNKLRRKNSKVATN